MDSVCVMYVLERESGLFLTFVMEVPAMPILSHHSLYMNEYSPF